MLQFVVSCRRTCCLYVVGEVLVDTIIPVIITVIMHIIMIMFVIIIIDTVFIVAREVINSCLSVHRRVPLPNWDTTNTRQTKPTTTTSICTATW